MTAISIALFLILSLFEFTAVSCFLAFILSRRNKIVSYWALGLGILIYITISELVMYAICVSLDLHLTTGNATLVGLNGSDDITEFLRPSFELLDIVLDLIAAVVGAWFGRFLVRDLERNSAEDKGIMKRSTLVLIVASLLIVTNGISVYFAHAISSVIGIEEGIEYRENLTDFDLTRLSNEFYFSDDFNKKDVADNKALARLINHICLLSMDDFCGNISDYFYNNKEFCSSLVWANGSKTSYESIEKNRDGDQYEEELKKIKIYQLLLKRIPELERKCSEKLQVDGSEAKANFKGAE